MRGTWRIQKLANKYLPTVGVLLYHRVVEVDTDPQLLCVTLKHFSEHLEVMRRFCDPLSLKALSKRLRGSLRHRSLVVTFDDGYVDNLHNAKPLLERHGIPATVFVTAGQVGSIEEFWWDELERVLLDSQHLPASLTLTLSGKVHSWEFGDATRATTPEIRRWHVEMKDNPGRRHQVYRELAPLIHKMDVPSRKSILRDLQNWAGIGGVGRLTHRAMTTTELHQLADGGLIEVGAHTMNHPCLSTLTVADQESEIFGSKQRLEEMLNKPVTSFAYPYGQKKDYTQSTIEIVKKAGFNCTCSNFEGVVRWGTDRYELPRLLVRDWDGDQFACQLEKWFS